MPTRDRGPGAGEVPGLALHRTDIGGAAVVRPTGRLDLTTYRELRDGLLKCAVDEPTAVVVRLGDGFECATPAFLAVFATVRLRVAEWPGVPVMLVGESPSHRRALAANGMRAVPRFTSLAAALAAVGRPPDRTCDETVLPDSPASGLLARRFVREACTRLRVTHFVHDAVTVATELVENAVRHGRSTPVLRLELRDGRLTVTVRDDNPDPPREPKPEPRHPRGWGLTLVSALSRTWGCYPWPRGGKVVWAVLGD
ncbi:ATP-binding protein [Saccharothrix sp. S26]|uniref:ATP-binding protein n=1 Tax=Saccharothrix sp. S26 TaxID=2907215 RepID=UPI001F1A1F7F|nr:ATP-binding protein [Saccharothrix sp. S26]MCE6999153.1 ATP-binding protein [Saccharothrix sp. S26]